MWSTSHYFKILMTYEFSWQDFSKESFILNFMKKRPVGVDLFHVGGRVDGRKEGQTDITRWKVAFGILRNSPENSQHLLMGDLDRIVWNLQVCE